MVKSVPKLLFILTTMMLIETMTLMLTNNEFILEWEIVTLMSMKMKLDFMIEWSNTLYSSMVMLISMNVMLFSLEYMVLDKNNLRFTYIIMCFIMSMNMLIFIPNIMSLLIGWDSLGITSFILIIYYNNSRSNSAGMLTMLMNRLGDTFLLMSIISTLNVGDWSMMETMNNRYSTMQWIGILMAAMSKSAQMPYSSWLPAAMAAPTPVSALVHSSTLVTAGVFLLYRLSNMVNNSNPMKTIIMASSILTMLMAGISAMYENDMKKIIALSTLSQLGLMMLPMSLNLPYLTLFHMCTHAMFKALLFISAGCMISKNIHTQDLRMYGQFINSSPMITSSMMIALSAMVSIPFMAGYYSKHKIMEWTSMLPVNWFIYMMLLISITLTTMYSLRLLLMAAKTPMMQPVLYKLYMPDPLTISLATMSTMSIIVGSMLQWLAPLNLYSSMAYKNTYQSLIMNLMTLLTMLSLFPLTMTNYKYMTNYQMKTMSSMMFMLPMSTQLMILPYLKLSKMLYKCLDQSWLENIMNLGTMKLLLTMSKQKNMTMSMHKYDTSLNISMLMAMLTTSIMAALSI